MEIRCVWAPASFAALSGSVSSTCSTPSVARKAILRPCSSFAIFALPFVQSLTPTHTRRIAGHPPFCLWGTRQESCRMRANALFTRTLLWPARISIDRCNGTRRRFPREGSGPLQAPRRESGAQAAIAQHRRYRGRQGLGIERVHGQGGVADDFGER